MIRKVIDLRTGLDYDEAHRVHYPYDRSVLLSLLVRAIYLRSTGRYYLPALRD